MTDNEIIKTWGKCANPKNDCYGDDYTCPYSKYDKGTGECFKQLREDVTDLINRQNAEIERLQKQIKTKDTVYRQDTELNKRQIFDLLKDLETTKAEAYKELVGRLRDRVVKKYEYTDIRVFNELDNLVKEMVGD